MPEIRQDPILAQRKLARETYDVAIKSALVHMVEAEKTNAELSTDQDLMPSSAAEGRRATHIRMAEVYALIAQACQKIPGQQF